MTPKQIAAIEAAFNALDSVFDISHGDEDPDDVMRWLRDGVFDECRRAKDGLDSILVADEVNRVALQTAKSRSMDMWRRCGSNYGELVMSDDWDGDNYEPVERAKRRMDKSYLLYQLRKQRLEDYDRATLEATS